MNSPDEPKEAEKNQEAQPAVIEPDASSTTEKGKENSSGDEGTGPDRDKLAAVIEAILFSAQEPLSSTKLAQIADAGDGRQVRSIISELQKEYDAQERAFQIEETGGGFQILTRPEYFPWVSRLRKSEQDETLSQAALETLAIIAYRQPMLRADLEDIRGVQSDHILRSLTEKKLIKVVGRSQELGRPLLYGTTRKFLEYFGLRALDELPPVEEPKKQAQQAPPENSDKDSST